MDSAHGDADLQASLESAYHEHESIVRALECGDAEWAEFAVRRHIRNTLAELMELLREQPMPEV